MRTAQRPVDEDGLRINDQIRARDVRLIGAGGEQVGIVPIAQALAAAEEAGLDLVEISPNAEPPVCKILNYGKYKYEQQKKEAEARKKQKTIDIKELKIRPGIEKHDYDVKMRAARRFFEDGDKVKFTLRYRGREMAHQEFGMELLNKIKAELSDVSKVEQEPKMEGKQVTMVLASLIQK